MLVSKQRPVMAVGAFPFSDKQAQSLQLNRGQKSGGVATRRQCIGIGVEARRSRHDRAFERRDRLANIGEDPVDPVLMLFIEGGP
jgi:hypothetical protein